MNLVRRIHKFSDSNLNMNGLVRSTDVFRKLTCSNILHLIIQFFMFWGIRKTNMQYILLRMAAWRTLFMVHYLELFVIHTCKKRLTNNTLTK